MIQALGDKVRSIGALTKRFIRQPSGTTAVEFGLLALPFFALKFAIIETALVFWAGQMFESGVSDASRQIRTGQVQSQDMDEAGFRELLCREIGVMFDCTTRLEIDVERAERFDAAERFVSPVDSDGNFTGTFGYDPGAGGQTVIVRAYYRWPMMFNVAALIEGLDLDPGDIGGSQRLLVATTAFRNEPFPD